jgi:hypothetical protein
MMLRIKPTHEALLAALLMVLALMGLGGVVAHDYAGRLPPGVVDDMYQDPMLSIVAGARRTRAPPLRRRAIWTNSTRNACCLKMQSAPLMTMQSLPLKTSPPRRRRSV